MGKLFALLCAALIVAALPSMAQQMPQTPRAGVDTAQATPDADKGRAESSSDESKAQARKERREHRRSVRHRHRRTH